MNNEEQQYLEKLRDHKFYLENLCQVKTKDKGFQPFILKRAQIDLFNAMRRYNKIMLLKARQLGMSTAVAGFIYVDTIMRPGITSALVGYNSDMVVELLDKIRTFHSTTPEELRPTVHFDSKNEMSFPAMGSKIVVLPSTKNVGRSYTLQNVLVTELAMWEDAEEKMNGLSEAVTPGGRIIIESTPKGQGSFYHRLWMTDNEYLKKKYGWWWEYTQEQMDKKKKEKGEMLFSQEYGCTFLATGRNVFDVKIVQAHRKNILKVGDINKARTNTQKDFIVREEDGWTIYRDPEVDGIYLCGGDSAEGVAGGDYLVATIFDRKTGEEVAMYRGHIPPDRFGDLLDKWGRKYNNALMVVEINNHGLTTVTILKQKIYPNLYFRPSKFETLSMGVTDRLGWRTTPITRPLLIDELAKAMRDGDLTIHSKKTLDEMSVFIYNDNGDMVPSPGFHDDCLKKGTLIKTIEGYKDIEDVKVGDLVLTHKNRYKRVEACIKKFFDNDWYNVKFNCQLSLGLSYNHPIYCAVENNRKNKRNRDIRDWVFPYNIKNKHYSVSKIEKIKDSKEYVVHGIDNSWGRIKDKKIKIIFNKDFAKFLGLFLADGTCGRNSNQLFLAFNEKDKYLVIEMKKYLKSIGLHVGEKYIEKQHCIVLSFVSKTLHNLMKQCYDKNGEKKMFNDFFKLGKNLKYVLDYWAKGDGWVDSHRSSYNKIIATTSKKLALTMRDIAWSVGYYATIHQIARRRYEIKNKDQYYINIKYSKNESQHLKVNGNDEYVGRVSSIAKTKYKGYVYNLQIEEDKSFIADGIVVHNCIFSVGVALQGFKGVFIGKLTQIDEASHLPRSYSY